MSRRITGIATALLLLTAIAALAFAARKYMADQKSIQRSYSETVDQRDVVDAASIAIAALQDAALRAQGYVLTGETSYSEAYSDDLQFWEDHFAVLEGQAARDPGAAALVAELSREAARVLKELASVVSLYDSGSHDAALDRIRKGSAVVYLGRARAIVAHLLELDGQDADRGSQRMLGAALNGQYRLVRVAGGILALMLLLAILPMVEARITRAAHRERASDERVLEVMK